MKDNRHNFQFEKGFSLIEMLLVISITAIIGATTIPVASNFLARNHLKNKTNEVISSLRTAQINALSGKEDSQWGVNISTTQITLYKGSSYAGRDSAFDQSFNIPSIISITQAEVVFDKLTGNPDTTATITISSDIGSNTVTVNEVGTVDAT